MSVRTELVAVPVTVTDGRGHHVSGLSQENFRVFENGRPQPMPCCIVETLPSRWA
jgi:hypothetical protein